VSDPITIGAPIRLVSGVTRCHRCGHGFSAVAIVAKVTEDGQADTALLSYVTDLPGELLFLITARFPSYGLEFSQTAEHVYYANTCPACGALAGDHFLRSPDGVFFPMDDEAVAALSVETLPIEGPLTVKAHCGGGSWLSVLEERTAEA